MVESRGEDGVLFGGLELLEVVGSLEGGGASGVEVAVAFDLEVVAGPVGAGAELCAHEGNEAVEGGVPFVVGDVEPVVVGEVVVDVFEFVGDGYVVELDECVGLPERPGVAEVEVGPGGQVVVVVVVEGGGWRVDGRVALRLVVGVGVGEEVVLPVVRTVPAVQSPVAQLLRVRQVLRVVVGQSEHREPPGRRDRQLPLEPSRHGLLLRERQILHLHRLCPLVIVRLDVLLSRARDRVEEDGLRQRVVGPWRVLLRERLQGVFVRDEHALPDAVNDVSELPVERWVHVLSSQHESELGGHRRVRGGHDHLVRAVAVVAQESHRLFARHRIAEVEVVPHSLLVACKAHVLVEIERLGSRILRPENVGSRCHPDNQRAISKHAHIVLRHHIVVEHPCHLEVGALESCPLSHWVGCQVPRPESVAVLHHAHQVFLSPLLNHWRLPVVGATKQLGTRLVDGVVVLVGFRNQGLLADGVPELIIVASEPLDGCAVGPGASVEVHVSQAPAEGRVELISS